MTLPIIDFAMYDRDYDHSRQINLHRWSKKTEIDEFVTHIYETFLEQPEENVRIKTKHLKALLLDLFIAGQLTLDYVYPSPIKMEEA